MTEYSTNICYFNTINIMLFIIGTLPANSLARKACCFIPSLLAARRLCAQRVAR